MSEQVKENPFPKRDFSDWKAVAETSLTGKNLEPFLTPKRLDGLALPSFVDSEPQKETINSPLFERAGDWQIGVRHLCKPGSNAAILDDLRGGANILTLDVSGIDGALSEGVDETLSGVFREMISLGFDGVKGPQLLGQLVKTLEKENAPISVSFGLDPFTESLLDSAELSIPDLSDQMAMVASLPARLFTLKGHRLHNAGASIVTELAAVLSAIVALLRQAEQQGLALDSVASRIAVSLACDEEYFAGIAKFRAFRTLVGNIFEACGIADRALSVEAHQSIRRHTTREPGTNAIRLSIAGMAAGLGGADVIYLNSHENPLDGGTASGRRLARNAQIMMLEESHLARVDDPAAGSFLLEDWTSRIANAVWHRFQRYEAEGSFPLETIKSDIVKDKSALLDSLKNDDIAIVSANRFPDLSTAPDETSPIADSLAQPYERLLTISDAFYRAKGRRPRYFGGPDGKGLSSFGLIPVDRSDEADVTLPVAISMFDALSEARAQLSRLLVSLPGGQQ